VASQFVFQIIHQESGEIVAQWEPRQDAKDIVDDLLRRAAAKGIGLLRTTAHVSQDIRAAWSDVLQDLKDQV
jgi:hypothetical protein